MNIKIKSDNGTLLFKDGRLIVGKDDTSAFNYDPIDCSILYVDKRGRSSGLMMVNEGTCCERDCLNLPDTRHPGVIDSILIFLRKSGVTKGRISCGLNIEDTYMVEEYLGIVGFVRRCTNSIMSIKVDLKDGPVVLVNGCRYFFSDVGGCCVLTHSKRTNWIVEECTPPSIYSPIRPMCHILNVRSGEYLSYDGELCMGSVTRFMMISRGEYITIQLNPVSSIMVDDHNISMGFMGTKFRFIRGEGGVLIYEPISQMYLSSIYNDVVMSMSPDEWCITYP